MNEFNLDILIEQLQSTNPPNSRLWNVLIDILPLISNESNLQLLNIFQKHSQKQQLFNVKQFFLCLHPFLIFTDRLTCMCVNKEWRVAIRQPEL
jgi:hypothetical protein